MILLFLFGVKKKKLTKRKNTGFRFEAAPEQLSSEAQELASLKQPALLFAEIHSYTFRLKTKAGISFIPLNLCKKYDTASLKQSSFLTSESIPALFASKLRPDFFVPSNPCKMHDSDSSEQSSLFVRICSYTFRPKTKAGFFCLIESLQKARF